MISVFLNWNSYRSAIVMPALLTLALWNPRPISWFFLMASTVIGAIGLGFTAIFGFNYVGSLHVIGWGTTHDEILLRGINFIAAASLSLTALYFWKRKNLFVRDAKQLSFRKAL